MNTCFDFAIIFIIGYIRVWYNSKLLFRRSGTLYSVERVIYCASVCPQCYQQHNAPKENGDARSYPLCALQLKVAMDGAKDTPTCIRRSGIPNLKSGAS